MKFTIVFRRDMDKVIMTHPLITTVTEGNNNQHGCEYNDSVCELSCFGVAIVIKFLRASLSSPEDGFRETAS